MSKVETTYGETILKQTQEIADMFKQAMPKVNTNKNGYEIRTKVLEMAQNNVWYPYVEMAEDPALKGLPAQLRMNAIASHGGTTKSNFEAFSLAASIVGKCHFCVKSHYLTLQKEGYTVEQLRDVGRIAAVINSTAKVLY